MVNLRIRVKNLGLYVNTDTGMILELAGELDSFDTTVVALLKPRSLYAGMFHTRMCGKHSTYIPFAARMRDRLFNLSGISFALARILYPGVTLTMLGSRMCREPSYWALGFRTFGDIPDNFYTTIHIAMQN